MPGSTTLKAGHGVDPVEHTDAVRLASVLSELNALLTVEGPNRLSDAQVSALCGGQAHHRQEFGEFIARLALDLGRKVAS
ncbi:hypothetical protein FBY35_2058 [Streptomyces sp. SLBN-118]|uniref:hypothetical protein n=1 Tax=Streptomyces sp. SLBN-118 TaxID=2768454 RepID=UPI00114F7FDF|nr:hypothetical protein [Streptomyces sp. SLBN-118]TQK51647.1 hypothetical protein FBY35_2058 [Streptomyces sp. SLBN-118]